MAAQLDLLTDGLALAIDGAQRAVDHADAASPGWSADARAMLRDYAEHHPYFMTEDVRLWAHGARRLPTPPDGRAWGGVILGAVRDGWLARIGFDAMKSPNCHANPKSLWRSALYRPSATTSKDY